MFLRKNWLPISVFIVAIVCVGLYLLTTQTPKAPLKIYKPVEVAQEATPKPPPLGETYETGHWHGDEWHAEPHDTPLIEEDVSMKDAFREYREIVKDEEPSAYDLVLRNYVKKHYEQYPDCQDHEAVLEDAAREAEWYVEHLEHRKKDKALQEEWRQLQSERDEFTAELEAAEAKYKGIDPNTISIEERQRIVDDFLDKIRVQQEKMDAHLERQDALSQQAPVSLTPMHTH